jgi:hypothetical protein
MSFEKKSFVYYFIFYCEKWRQHLERIDSNRTAKQALQYKQKGRRNMA